MSPVASSRSEPEPSDVSRVRSRRGLLPSRERPSGTEMPLDQALRYETDLTIILQTTADRAEGVQAFAEKREPRFGGE